MNKSEQLIEAIDQLLNEKMIKTGRFHVHVTNAQGDTLVKAHASTTDQVHSVLHNAAKHVIDGGMDHIRAKVHDTFLNKDYKHKSIKAADGKVTFDGPHPNSYATA